MKKWQMALLSVLAVLLPVLAEPSRPNILLLLADDLGIGDLGCYGQKLIQTPSLDQLAKDGMRFAQFYSGTSVCSPSRASLMTGKHVGHATIRGNSGYYGDHKWDRVALRKDELTLGEMMKQAGYETGFIGKWHLETPDDLSGWAFARGFDFAVQPQWPSRFEGTEYDENVHYFGNKGKSITYNENEHDCIDSFRTDLLLDYFGKRKKDKPFFFYMSYRISHVREQYIRDTKLYADKGWDEKMRRYAARVTLLDAQVGRVLEKLEETGELDNTLVIFTSDNGIEHGFKEFNSAAGLRGKKRDMYEGGIRAPLLVYWKGKVLPGSVSDHVSAFWDFMPTFADLAGIDSPAQSDGISILPTLIGKSEEQKQHDYLYWEIQLDGWWHIMPDGGFRQGVRKGDWKAVRYGADQPIQLYNLAEDEAEKNNVANAHPEVVKQMAKILKEARTETDYFPFGGVVQKTKACDEYKGWIRPAPKDQ